MTYRVSRGGVGLGCHSWTDIRSRGLTSAQRRHQPAGGVWQGHAGVEAPEKKAFWKGGRRIQPRAIFCPPKSDSAQPTWSWSPEEPWHGLDGKSGAGLGPRAGLGPLHGPQRKGTRADFEEAGKSGLEPPDPWAARLIEAQNVFGALSDCTDLTQQLVRRFL